MPNKKVSWWGIEFKCTSYIDRNDGKRETQNERYNFEWLHVQFSKVCSTSREFSVATFVRMLWTVSAPKMDMIQSSSVFCLFLVSSTIWRNFWQHLHLEKSETHEKRHNTVEVVFIFLIGQFFYGRSEIDTDGWNVDL